MIVYQKFWLFSKNYLQYSSCCIKTLMKFPPFLRYFLCQPCYSQDPHFLACFMCSLVNQYIHLIIELIEISTYLLFLWLFATYRNLFACGHNRVIDLYIDSIVNTDSCPMIGIQCESYEQFSTGYNASFK